MKKNVASQVIGAQMVSATDGSAFTGSVTCYVTGDGGTQAVGSVGSGACAHEGNGFHSYSPAQAETNYDHIAFTFVGTGAVPATIQVYTSFPQTGDGYGRLGAPAGASIAADIAALPTDADVNAACDSALADYDAPTKAEMDSAFATTNGYIDTEVAAILAAVDTEVAALVSEIAKVPKSDGTLTLNATAVAAIKAALEAAGSHLTLVKAKTDGLNFTGTDVKATLDGEEVTPTAASKTGYSLVAAYDAAKTSAQAGDAMAVGVGGIQSTSFAAGAIDAAAMAADAGTEIADAVKALVIESQGNYTLQQALSIILAVLAGQTADNGATLKTANGAATRVTATIDENNNRTAMTLAPSA